MRSPAKSEAGHGDGLILCHTLPGPTSRRCTADRGQATVEVALAMPLLITLLLAGVQVAVIVRDQLAVIAAAREGARAAAVSSAPVAEAETAARQSIRLDNVRVDVAAGDRTVTVTVRRRTPTDVPLIGLLIPDVTVTGVATMRVEP
jgi:TadE-like protein